MREVPPPAVDKTGGPKCSRLALITIFYGIDFTYHLILASIILFRGNTLYALQHVSSEDHKRAIIDPEIAKKPMTTQESNSDYQMAKENKIPDSFFAFQAMILPKATTTSSR